MRSTSSGWTVVRALVATTLAAAVVAVPHAASNAASVSRWKDYRGPAVTISVWSYPQDDPSLLGAEKTAFEKKYPKITIKYTSLPEDNYVTKLNTAIEGRRPPDVAIIEDQAWMKSGKVVRLDSYFKQWGVNWKDLNPGGIGRLTLEQNPKNGFYAIGDWMDGNVIFYNKKLFKAAKVPFPSATKSMTWDKYASVCRKLAKPSANPTQAVYGCSVTDWMPGIWSKWLFGQNGRQVMGNMNSKAFVHAWNVATALVRDKMAPSGTLLQSVGGNGEPDLFKQGRIAMTWSDFTFSKDYTANKIDYGVAPFVVPAGSPSFVDTWTAAWGTFKDSPHRAAALQYLKFIATDAQKIVATHSFIPPLSQRVAKSAHYGKGNPAARQFLLVLKQAKRQVFVPPLGPGGYNSGDIYNKMVVQRQTDAKPLLDAAARKTASLLNKAWAQWKSLKG